MERDDRREGGRGLVLGVVERAFDRDDAVDDATGLAGEAGHALSPKNGSLSHTDCRTREGLGRMGGCPSPRRKGHRPAICSLDALSADDYPPARYPTFPFGEQYFC